MKKKTKKHFDILLRHTVKKMNWEKKKKHSNNDFFENFQTFVHQIKWM